MGNISSIGARDNEKSGKLFGDVLGERLNGSAIAARRPAEPSPIAATITARSAPAPATLLPPGAAAQQQTAATPRTVSAGGASASASRDDAWIDEDMTTNAELHAAAAKPAELARAATDARLSGPDHFGELWNNGFKRLIPIIPPGAELSERSHLKPDQLGKTPGVRSRAGKWHGFNWQQCRANENDLREWRKWGAGVGLLTGPVDPDAPDGEQLIAIDADVLDMQLAGDVRLIVETHFGRLPCRIGRDPKAAYYLRVSGPVRTPKVHFGKNASGEALFVEILAAGKQVVLGGVHPGTMKPYKWYGELPHLHKLTITTPEKFGAFVDALAALPGASLDKGKLSPADRGPIDPERLRGDPELVARAVRALPNTVETFPAYADMIEVGCAIRGALPEDPDLGLELFTDWCEKWDGFTAEKPFSEEFVESKWRTFENPRLGAQFLFDKATVFGGFEAARVWFDDLSADTASSQADELRTLFEPTPEVGAASAAGVVIAPTPFVWRAPATLPPRQWLYAGHLVRRFVSATVAAPGVGKSTLGLAEAVAMASGLPLLGHHVATPLRVWSWNGEDPMEELERRVAAVCLRYGVTSDQIEGRLFLDSGRDTEIKIAHAERNGLRIAMPVVGAVISAIAAHKIDVLTIDPFVSSHSVAENDNGAIDAVVKQWARVADETNCAVELVHHSRKTGGASVGVEDARGASALLGAVRSARVLNPMTEEEAGRAGVDNHRAYFRLDNGKANLAPPPDKSEWFRLASLPLGNGDLVGVAEIWEWPDALAGISDDDLSKVRATILEGDHAADVRAANWAGHAVASTLGLDIESPADKARVKSLLRTWIERKALRVEVRHSKRDGREKRFIVVGD